MTQIFFNNFETTFIGPVQATPTSGTPATELGFGVLQISDGAASVLLNPTGGDFYVVTAFKRAGTVESDYEVLRITAVNNAVPGECRITVLRGQEGTTPKSYVAGDRVAMRATAGSYGNFAQNTDARLTDARTPTGGAGGVLSGTYPNPGFAVDMATQAELDAATGTREPTIAAGTVAQYWRGDKTWRDLATDVRTAALTGFSTATGTAVAAADSVLAAFGKLQAQINGHFGAGGATHPNATASVSGFLSAADKAKLDGVASGATANAGTVTSVGLAAPVEFTIAGSPVSGAGTLTFAKASQMANQFYAAPNGASGVPVFRAMTAADIPTLNQSTTGNAATATALQTARTINGVSFNGSADITLPTVNTTGDQTIAGVKTFTSQIVASGGVQGNVTGSAANVTGTVAVANGGTGATTAAAACTNLGAATLTGAETLTNKTIAFGSNTLTGVQPTLVSGTNIRTINGSSLLGSGNLVISGAEVVRVARTSNTALSSANRGNLIDITSGTFTQTFDACSSLGNGWFVYIHNSGTGDITLDPNASETIDGLTSFVMYPGEVRLVQCDGTALRSVVLNPFYRAFTATGTFTKPPGYSLFSGLAWGGGGSGGKGGATASGGGGGACHPFTLLSSVVGSTETVTIGAGGAAVTASTTPGNNGGNTTFGSLLTAHGGGGGAAQAAAANCSAGTGGGILGAGLNGGNGQTILSGGQPSSGTDVNIGFGGGGSSLTGSGDAVYGGAAGGPGVGSGSGRIGRNSVFGGGGGGGTGSFGATVAGGTSVYAGGGGASALTDAATAGTAPAGGGGATQTGASSGAGARGELRIWGVI